MLRSRASHYLIAAAGIAGVTASLVALRTRINSTTVALAMLLVVLFVAALWGSRPAMFASALGMLCLNFFFLPPIGTLTIADPDNWVALAAFLITAATAGQLSARAKRRAVGLAIAKGIVEAHGGHIRVEDADGGCGARFLFTLPIGDTDEAEETIDSNERRDK